MRQLPSGLQDPVRAVRLPSSGLQVWPELRPEEIEVHHIAQSGDPHAPDHARSARRRHLGGRWPGWKAWCVTWTLPEPMLATPVPDP
ncbi:hypothetical protein GCM10027074_76460 [Streptomyces deserti]